MKKGLGKVQVLVVSLAAICLYGAFKAHCRELLGATSPNPGLFHATTTLKQANDSVPDPNIYQYTHPYLAVADSLYEAGAYQDALQKYKTAAARLKQEKQWKDYVWAIISIAVVYSEKDEQDYQSALPYLEEALKIGPHYLGPQHPFLASAYFYLGRYWFRQNEPEKSLNGYNKALRIRKDYFGENNKYVANTYHAIGEVYTDLLFDEYEAGRYIEKALAIRRHILKPTDPSFVRSYYTLLIINRSLGNYEKAMSYCFQAMQNVPQLQQHQQDWQELFHGNLAGLYLETGDTVKGIQEFDAAIRLNKQHGGRQDYLASYLIALGDIYRQRRNYPSAIAYYTKVIHLFDRPSFREERMVWQAHFLLGIAWRELGRFNPSIWHLNQCLTERKRSFGPRHPETAAVYEQLGKLHGQYNLIDQQLAYLRAALASSLRDSVSVDVYSPPPARQFNHPLRSIPILTQLAHVLKQLPAVPTEPTKNLQTAWAYYALADTLLTQLRAGYDRETSKLTLAENNHTLYEEGLDCLLRLYGDSHDQSWLERALGFMDKRKSGLLLESLEEDAVFGKINFLRPYRHQRRVLLKEFYHLQHALDEENNKTRPDSVSLSKLHTRIINNETQQQQLRVRLKQTRLPALDFPGGRGVRLSDVRTSLLADRQGVITYLWGDSAVYALSIGPGGAHFTKTPNTRELQQQLQAYCGTLANGYRWRTSAADFKTFRQSASWLYKTLFKPAADGAGLTTSAGNRPGQRMILIIPDGPLFNVPFEALLHRDAPSTRVDYHSLAYLVHHYVFRYHYSLNLALNHRTRAGSPLSLRVLALGFSGDSLLPKQAGRLREFRRDAYGELPGSAAELAAIATALDGEFYLGDEATEQRFKSAASRHSILHLAVHGQANSEQPLRSRLVFKNAKDTTEDGSLHAYELYGTELNAKMVVLSACETGVGRIYKGEGAYSLARGFLYAGCPTVVSSLWKVNDLSTAAIMAPFYRHVSSGGAVDQSLWQARQHYLSNANSRSAHPSNWAALVVVGSGQAIVSGPAGRFSYRALLLVIAGSIAAVALAVYLYRSSARFS